VTTKTLEIICTFNGVLVHNSAFTDWLLFHVLKGMDTCTHMNVGRRTFLILPSQRNIYMPLLEDEVQPRQAKQAFGLL
jgi:hypothetical protein